jgi:putative endonuclease
LKESISERGDLVAQLVEQYTFNVWALGSNPSQITKTRSHSLSGFFVLIFIEALRWLTDGRASRIYREGPGFESQPDHKNTKPLIKWLFCFKIYRDFNMAYCYILYSEKINKFYVGACTNIDRRLYEHNIGHSKFTKTGMPWILKLSIEFEDLIDAKRYEAYVKKQKSRKFIEALINPQ